MWLMGGQTAVPQCSLEGQRPEVLAWLSARWSPRGEDMAYLGIGEGLIGEGHGPCSSLPLPAGLGRVGHCSARSPVTADPLGHRPWLPPGHLGRERTLVDVTDPNTRGGVPLHSGARKHLRNPWGPPRKNPNLCLLAPETLAYNRRSGSVFTPHMVWDSDV